jgi:hypothetical protein
MRISLGIDFGIGFGFSVLGLWNFELVGSPAEAGFFPDGLARFLGRSMVESDCS